MSEQELQEFFEKEINKATVTEGYVISPMIKGLYKHKYFFVIIHNAHIKSFKKFVNKLWLKENRYVEYFKGDFAYCIKMSYDIEGW